MTTNGGALVVAVCGSWNADPQQQLEQLRGSLYLPNINNAAEWAAVTKRGWKDAVRLRKVTTTLLRRKVTTTDTAQ